MIGDGFDAAIRITVLPDSSLIARRLCGMPRYLVGSPRYLKTKRVEALGEFVAASLASPRRGG
jgi:DNA-binding transcriptional LysR family regulator